MTAKAAQLIDQSRTVLATAHVMDEGTHFRGTIDLAKMPESLRMLFVELEEIVNGQEFNFLDEIQDKIAATSLKVVFGDGTEALVKDLQIYPTTGEVSFKLAKESIQSISRS
jgi:hypothetical protein